MSDQDIARLALCGVCCVWPLAVWFGINLLVLPGFRRRVLGPLRGRLGEARAEREI